MFTKAQIKAWEKLIKLDTKNSIIKPFYCQVGCDTVATTSSTVLGWFPEEHEVFGEKREVWPTYQKQLDSYHEAYSSGYTFDITPEFIEEVNKAAKEKAPCINIPGTCTYIHPKRLKYLLELTKKKLSLCAIKERPLEPVAWIGIDFYGLIAPVKHIGG